MLRSSPDGTSLIGTGSSSSNREATVYGEGLSVTATLRAHSTRVFAVATDGTHHATGHMNGNIQIWDAATLAPVCDLQHGQRRLPVCGLAVHRGVLVSGSMDSTAKCYSISSRQCRATLQHKLEHSVNSVDVDEGLVATASDDGTARLWEHGAAASKHVLQHAAEVNAVSLAADLVATGCHDRLVRLFAVHSGQLMRTLRGHGREVVAVCVRHGMVLSGAADAAVRVWLMEEEEAVAVLEGHSGAVNGLALAPGGSLIASASSDEVLVWQPVAAR